MIWITGFSAAGKTTVGRKVENALKQNGLATVFLDGDDLRRIFGGKWGYERGERLELAKVYLRLCSHLAAQQITVIISAIAMYAEVYQWAALNIPRYLQVYLRVPEEERKRRDSLGRKNVYTAAGAGAALGYDEPLAAHLVVDNHGATSPETVASSIVSRYLARSTGEHAAADHGKSAHWNAVYSRREPVPGPSPFAVRVAGGTLPKRARLLEVGCGSGRDSIYFSKLGHDVCAIDTSRSAIDFCLERHAGSPVEFRHGSAEDLLAAGLAGSFDAVYCRFVLHAMTEPEQTSLCRAARRLLRTGGLFLIECRSVNDPLMRLGDIISPTERIHGHYRRFIVMDELIRSLVSSGFLIEAGSEGTGLAVFHDEDPVVIRITARAAASQATGWNASTPSR